MMILACLAALLPLSLPSPVPGESAFYEVAIRDLTIVEGELPAPSEEMGWEDWRAASAMWPHAVLDGAGEAYYESDDPTWYHRINHSTGSLHVRTPDARDVRGTLFLPNQEATGMVRIEFEIPAERAGEDGKTFLRAQAGHYERLLDEGGPGAGWFRHRRDAALKAQGEPVVPVDPQPMDGVRPDADESDLEETFDLFSGGRAVSENLQLDRLLPAGDDGEETVELSSIEGITVREMDWAPLLEGLDPALDPLASLIPADQHAAFFPTFQDLVDVIDESSELGEPIVTLFESRSQDAGTRERTERQLCLALDAFTRLFGPKVIESVAFTGSDPYLRTGSDVAMLFETGDAESLFRIVQERQNAVKRELDTGEIVVEMEDVFLSGVVTPARGVSSYVSVVGDAVVVTNSMHQLGRIRAVADDAAASLAAAPEYRFFRGRYALGADGESTLVVVSDAAIRRWCSARWRIGASRRTRAAAVLADLTAEHLDRIAEAEGAEVALEPDARFPGLGDLTLSGAGIRSSVYGTIGFLTPIAELELERVTAREADLYRRWRDGYQRYWSRYFDPIALSIAIQPDRLALDLTVMPLILGTDYDEMRGFIGESELGPESGDPHEGTMAHFAIALDPESETLSDIGESLAGMISELGANPLSWMGGSLGVFLDQDPYWEDVLASDDLEDARENLLVDLNEIPLVAVFDVSSGLRLATFLATMRVFMDQTVPGLLTWNEETSGEHRYVQITADDPSIEDASVFYATTPRALVFSLQEEALLRSLERLAGRGKAEAGDPAAKSPWLGESVAIEIDRDGLRILQFLGGDELRLELRDRSWDNLAVLNEWRRGHPDRDPVAFHREHWGDTLRCPGGGDYVWNAAFQTMESSVFGHPGQPRHGVDLPPGIDDLTRLRFGLTFENDGLRSGVAVDRE